MIECDNLSNAHTTELIHCNNNNDVDDNNNDNNDNNDNNTFDFDTYSHETHLALVDAGYRRRPRREAAAVRSRGLHVKKTGHHFLNNNSYYLICKNGNYPDLYG